MPKGNLLLIGGHEYKGEIGGENLKIHPKKDAKSHFEILGALISKIPRAHHIIEIIASASSIPLEMEKLYVESYKKEGFTHVGIIKVDCKEDANNKTSIHRVQNAHAVFFTGGDQSKLVKSIADTELLKTIKKKYYADQHFIVGGTSAGAMALPEIIITGGVIREALFKNDIHISTGFDLIKNILVDTHFIKRGRFGRLAHAVIRNPLCLGMGLEENTALLISAGKKVTCLGAGMVILIDGRKIKSSNLDSLDDKTPLVAANLKISILAEGSRFILRA